MMVILTLAHRQHWKPFMNDVYSAFTSLLDLRCDGGQGLKLVTELQLGRTLGPGVT